jgi:hypothetical protein
MGLNLGPLVFGGIALAGGITAALWAGVAVMGLSGLIVLVAFRETEPGRRTRPPPWETHPEWVAP